MPNDAESLARKIRLIVEEYFGPVVEEPIKRFEKDLEAVINRLESVEREVRADPRKNLREELEKLETRARLLKQGL